MISMGTFGTLLGIVFEAKVLHTQKYKNFNKTNGLISALRLIVMIGGQVPFLILGSRLTTYTFDVLGVH